MASQPASAYIYAFWDALLTKRKTKLVFGFVGVGMSRGSSREKGFGSGRGKGGTKGTPIVWEGSLSPNFFEEPVYQFPLESKSDFTKECSLRGYDNRKEDWPKCMHGETA